jgi:hypothetical protein
MVMLRPVSRVVGLPTENKRQLLNVTVVVVVTVALLWPAYLNGEPFYMTDTATYLRGADAAIHYLTGQSSAWTEEFFKRYPSGPSARAVLPGHGSGEVPVVLAGRSIYYGLLLYAAQWFGNFWAIAILQAILVSIAIFLTVVILRRMLGSTPSPAFVIGCGLLLAACTPVGYFASYLMPDIFGGLGLLAFGHLVFLRRENGRYSHLFWLAMLAAAVLFHTANFLLIGLLGLAAALLPIFRRRASRAGLGAVLAAVLLGAAGQALFTWGVKQATGAAPVRQPFIAARIIADGPGYEYLREHCPEARLVFCRAASFEERISDALLWSKSPELGIFQALSPAEQRLAASQETEFVLAVLRDRPLDLIGSSIGAFYRQLTHFDLESFNYTASTIDQFNRKIPSPFIDDARQSRAYANTMPIAFVEWSTVAAVLASLAAIFRALLAMLRREGRLPERGTFLLTLVLGVFVNAAVCGAFSTPKGRYQMRLIWVLPLAALALGRVRGGEPRHAREGEMPVARLSQPSSTLASS